MEKTISMGNIQCGCIYICCLVIYFGHDKLFPIPIPFRSSTITWGDFWLPLQFCFYCFYGFRFSNNLHQFSSSRGILWKCFLSNILLSPNNVNLCLLLIIWFLRHLWSGLKTYRFRYVVVSSDNFCVIVH